MPQISVVVPVYKVEAYLPRCIDSILAQSLEDYELILVDDGSPDNCGAICDEYAERDTRIRVFHLANGGVSFARNRGVSEAKGKYIVFVDSDDYIHRQMLELLSYVLDHTEYPFVHCAFHRVYEGETETTPANYKCSLESIQEFTSEQGMLKMMDWKTYGHYIIKGMYRTSYIDKIPFPLNTRWEDILWSGMIVGKAKKYAYIPCDLYSYYMRRDSLIHTLEWRVQKQYFQVFTNYLELVRKLTPGVADKIELSVFQSFIEREDMLDKAGCLNSKAKKEISKAAKRCNMTFLKILLSDYRLRRKGIMLLSHLYFPAGCGLRRKLIR